MSFWIPCSAPPKARAKLTFARLWAYSAAIRLVIGAGHRLLRLHHFDVVGHAGREPVAGLHQRLIGQVEIVSRHRHLVGRRANVQKRRADLIIDLAGQIGKLILTLLQGRLGLDLVAADASSVKQVDFRRSRRR